MSNNVKKGFLDELRKRSGSLKKLADTQSLYNIGDGSAIVYIRYSKLHDRNQSFYGLRKKDLQLLEGHPSILCFLWEGQDEPLLIPFSEYEELFQSLEPADDGQYKVQIYIEDQGIELYIPKVGRFNIEGYKGWTALNTIINSENYTLMPDLSHPQVQTLLGAIGAAKGYDIWIPQIDRSRLDWKIAKQFNCRENIPLGYSTIENIVQEVDVVWIAKGSSDMKAFFEVEHSTPIYPGLLRFNDIHLISPNVTSRFSIVANDLRRTLFVRQLNRPTFKTSGLSELCTFLEYFDVYNWHSQVKSYKGDQ